ncbi:MAG: GTPase ObgE [Aeriscardovia sp.]|nr:GTPase ObgE [Aeriscardovia sp.]
MTGLVDKVSVRCSAGDGGNGETAVRRMKGKPFAGASGGNGGDGGSVIIRAVSNLADLSSIKPGFLAKAHPGECGKGSMHSGTKGEDCVLKVPVGTVVTDSSTGEVLADLSSEGQEVVAAKGGRGGKGNFALSSPSRRAPGFALKGTRGEERDVTLELKISASCALIGLPNAGKSSLLAALSNARPQVGDWEFTTLSPNLGAVKAGESSFTLEDVPGLIAGAALGKGLGLEFLRHIERIPVLAFVIDPMREDPLSTYKSLEKELESYVGRLPEGAKPFSQRPRIVILSKADLYGEEDLAAFEGEFKNVEAVGVSASTHEGVRELKFALLDLVEEAHSERKPEEGQTPTLNPLKPGRLSKDFSVAIRSDSEEGIRYEVDGEIIRIFIEQTDFSNDEAVGYLSDRLAALGVEDLLVKAGIKPGDEVRLGNPADAVAFSWNPSLTAGKKHMRASASFARGADERLETLSRTRRTNRQRRSEHKRG